MKLAVISHDCHEPQWVCLNESEHAKIHITQAIPLIEDPHAECVQTQGSQTEFRRDDAYESVKGPSNTICFRTLNRVTSICILWSEGMWWWARRTQRWRGRIWTLARTILRKVNRKSPISRILRYGYWGIIMLIIKIRSSYPIRSQSLCLTLDTTRFNESDVGLT